MDTYSEVSRLKEYAYHMRKHALKMSVSAGKHAVHFGAGMSMIEILAVLYGSVMHHDPSNPNWEERDRFILSKGHGVIGYYAALREAGYIADCDLEKFEQDGSFLMGHPVRTQEKGIEFTNGSLGMGLSLGIGTAIAVRKKGFNNRTFVLIGDGELDEGAVWEGIMAAPQFGLNRLCVIVDRNHLQLGGETETIMAHRNLKSKYTQFGWQAYEVNGHDIADLLDVFSHVGETAKPTAIIADTVKGRGFGFSENNNAWHHAVMTESQYEQALKELEDNYNGDNF